MKTDRQAIDTVTRNEKNGFFPFFPISFAVGSIFFAVKIHVGPSQVLDHSIRLGKAN